MDSKYILIVLIIVLLTSSIVFGASSTYYGKTYVYFEIPGVFSFNVTLPNDVEYNSSQTGNPTADENFSSSSGNEKNVTIYVTGTEYRQNSTVIGDETNVSNYKVKNTGNANINITLCLNESMPASAVLFGTKSADPQDGPSEIPDCSSGAWIANNSLPSGETDELWIWANFTGFATATARELYINSTQSGM